MAIKISDILKALNEADVRYLIVGGVAVNLHGHVRFTKDLDLIFAFDEENLRRAMKILADIHFSLLLPIDIFDFANSDLRKQWIDEKGMVVFQLIDRVQIDRQINVFVDEPIPFERMYQNRENAALGGTNAPIALIEHLIEMKTIAGRPQDISDIQKLRFLQMRNSREKKEDYMPIPSFESLNPWEKADYLALEFYVNNSTPEQRLQWLEDAHDFALEVAYERHSRGLVTIDDEGNIWPRTLALASSSSGLAACSDHI